ncbi:MAG: glycosyltransferase family 4 protein [Longimicrobiales bacterium]
MSGLRFAMLTTFYPPHNFGGDGIAIQRLSRALALRGHHVTVIHDVDAFNALHHGPEPAPQHDIDGIDVVPLRSGMRVLSPMLTQQTGRPVFNGSRIARILREREIDVTIFHNISLIGGPGLLREGRGVRLYEAHEHWLVCPTHVLWRHGRELCTGRECLRCVLRQGRPPQAWRYTGALERELCNVDAFIAKSAFSRDKHHEFGFSREMEVIPYFLPETGPANVVPAHSPGDAVQPSVNEGRPYFLFVGRLERIKGLDDVIPAFGRFPEADLLIAGDGEHGETLRRMSGGKGNVRFLGRLAPDRLAELYRNALALIVPSVCFETFGIILIEAFQQGTPVIARRIGPFPEIIERAEAGLLFETTDDMLGTMRRVWQESGLRQTLAANGRAAFQRFWSEQAVVPLYLDLVRRIAEEKGERRIVETLLAGSIA